MPTTYSIIGANKRRSFLLIGMFVILIAALGWGVGYLSGGRTSYLVFAAIIAVVMALVGYFGGDSIILSLSGAHRIAKQDNPYVYRMVENLCITAGLPVPAVYVIDDPAPNAFATGRDPKHASIAVTTGIVQMLENEELEGVIAHELSHIGNYDARLMMLVSVLVGVIVMLSDIFLRSMFWRGGRSGRDDRGGAGQILALAGFVLIILSPLFAQLIQLAVSRRREFLADASGALLTRYPDGLASALQKIGAYSQPMRRASNATAHLYISNPFGNKALRGMAKLFSTHPPIAERIAALKKMSGTA